MGSFWTRVSEHWVRIALGAVVLLVFIAHAAQWMRIGLIDQMENWSYDKRLLLTMPNKRDDRIVIVDIDEKSLTAEGRWPWGRDKLANLVEQLFAKYHAGLVGFDVVFAEPDTSSGLKVLENLSETDFKEDPGFKSHLQTVRPKLDFDGLFGAAIQKYPVILGYYFNFGGGEEQTAKIGTLPKPTFVKGTFTGKNVEFRRADGFGANLAQLQGNALSAGHFNPLPDPDGVVRRVPMLIEYDGAYYASLSLEIVRQALGISEIVPKFEEPLFGGKGYPGLEWLQIGKYELPVDKHVQSLVPYRGRKGSFPYVSATDILRGAADSKILEHAIVLVGTTAPGLLDLRATPVDEAYPGVEIHANLIAGIIDHAVKQLPEYTLGAEVLLLLLFGLVMLLVTPALSPLLGTALTAGLLVVMVGFNLVVWSFGNFVLPIASGVLMLLTMFLLNMSYGYFVETRGKRQLTGLFGHYVPPELVDEMAKRPDAYSLEAESREMTVLFSDVRGFTTISEGLTPKDLADLMNEFLTPMTRVIHERRGTIDKYMGDAIMAFWGAPLEDGEHARHALQAGLEMLSKVAEINKAFVAKGWPEIRIGVGINSGVMSVGNMGSEFRMAYTVLGDAVNLGSRLEGLTKGYSVSLIVSETTKEAVPEYAYREIDRVRVKGKDKPITIFEPLCARDDLDARWKDELKLYREALRMYRAQEWDMAEMNFLNLARSSRSPGLYKVYVERVAHFRHQPPNKDWDGVFTHTSK
jgi:adenylate cyclase